jgi:ABC-type multidrug transport system fused ATPase/permease subunit
MNPLTLVIVNIATILLIRSGAILVDTGDMTQGEVVAMINYMAQILVELVKFASTLITVNKALACADRIEQVFEIPAGMQKAETDAPDDVQKDTCAIRFCNASLTYPDAAEESLVGIDFAIPHGATVGIIGSTGAGKTSLIHLISRFYDVSAGAVLVDGQDVRTYEPTELRDRVALVPQKAVLFRGTVRSNLLWGNENATDEELWEALTLAQAADFVREKEGGLDAPVAQNGKNFSSGQKQRLTIARALVKKAPILILDDSSSALDYATDAALRGALRSLPYSPTVLLISQRTASIRHADSIVVLEDGEIVGIGRHEELLESCEVYREIHESQYRKGGDGR